MPIISRSELPKPKDWQEFEDMVLEALRLKWGSPNLQKNGRPGQKQDGVDIFGPDYLERPTGIQCKRCQEKIKLKTIEEEVEKSEKFTETLTAVYVVTSCNHDAKIQQEVRSLSKKRTSTGLSAVGVMFWEDIIDSLLLSPNIFRRFYPMINFPTLEKKDVHWHHRAALELGNYTSHLRTYLELLKEYNPFTVSDPDCVIEEFKEILKLVYLYAKALLPVITSNAIQQDVDRMVVILDTYRFECDESRNLVGIGKKLIIKMNNAGRYLLAPESHLFDIGRELGSCESITYPSTSTLKNISGKILMLFPGAQEKIDEILSIEETSEPSYLPQRIYNIVYHEIWWNSLKAH